MIFVTKKKLIRLYLEDRSDSLSEFDRLLADYLDGSFKSFFEENGISRIELYIDWYDDIKCIDLQGRRGRDFINIQVEETDKEGALFGIAIDPDEPKIEENHKLVSRESFYSYCRDVIVGS